MTQMRVGRVQTHLNFSTPMNATLRRAAITAIAGFSLALTALSVQAQNAAIVNGKAIPSVRVDEFVASLTQQGRPDTPDLRNAVRDELIAREIFVQEAERKGLTRNPETQRQLESARQDILIRALIRDSLKTNPVTDADVKAEYDKVVKSSGGQEYRARHILVETEPEAKAIIDQLKKGAKFEDLAKKSKDTGSAPRPRSRATSAGMSFDSTTSAIPRRRRLSRSSRRSSRNSSAGVSRRCRLICAPRPRFNNHDLVIRAQSSSFRPDRIRAA